MIFEMVIIIIFNSWKYPLLIIVKMFNVVIMFNIFPLIVWLSIILPSFQSF